MRHHRLIRSTALLSVVGGTAIATTALFGAPAGAAEPCVDARFPGTRLIDWDGVNPKVEYSPAVTVALAPGTYAITGTSHDDYPARTGVTQSSEVWDLQFLDATGKVIATSDASEDLPDRVAVADWSGSMGTVTLTVPATAVRAHHRPDAHADGSANSVEPTAATMCSQVPATTTTTTSTTTTTTTTTVTAPVRSETTIRSAVLAETTVVTSSPPTTAAPSAGPRAALAVTGSEHEAIQGVALVLVGAGILLLGYRAQSIARQGQRR